MQNISTFYTLFFVVLLFLIISSENSALADEVVLQDKLLLVAFDSKTGVLTRLERKSTHWRIDRRAELGVSFRLHVPLPDRRYNFVLGQKQVENKVEKISEKEVRLQWKNLVNEHEEVLIINENTIIDYQVIPKLYHHNYILVGQQ